MLQKPPNFLIKESEYLRVMLSYPIQSWPFSAEHTLRVPKSKFLILVLLASVNNSNYILFCTEIELH